MTHMIWTAQQVITAVGGKALGNEGGNKGAGGNTAIHGIAIDSRATQQGDLFIALKGKTHDGNRFTGDAIKQGAVAVMVAKDSASPPKTALAIAVDEPLAGLERLGLAARMRHQGTRIAITGSIGKTGTRMLVATALGAYGKTHFSHGNLNNHIGVPLSLARMPQDAQFGVFEAGMDHAGELAPISHLIAPHIAIITAIADSHSSNFSGLDAIAMAKAEIFSAIKGGIAFINADDDFAALLAEEAEKAGAARILRFGYATDADYQIVSTRRVSDGLSIEAKIRGEIYNFSLGMTAAHWALSAMMALGVVDALGLPLQPALAALAKAQDLPGRGAVRDVRVKTAKTAINITLIDDSYNANPASMRGALHHLASMPNKNRRVAILGDMLELDAPEAKHQALADAVKAAGVALLITTGKYMRHLNDALSDAPPDAIETYHADDHHEALRLAENHLKNGDVVLVKASNGMRLNRLIEAWQTPTSTHNGDSHVA